MYCKSCGAAMDESFLVCQMCGIKKGAGKAFCEKCGAVRQFGAEFCQECGNKFVDEEAAVDASAASVPYAQQTPAQQFESGASQNQSEYYMPAKKFCRSCGAQVMNNQVVCTKCGVKVGEGRSFCPHCAAPVANPEAVACVSCGMSLKEPINVGNYVNQFADNFTEIFKKNDVLTLLLDYGANFASFLTMLLSMLPIIYIYVIGYTESFSAFRVDAFTGILFILAFLVSVARFVPHVDDLLRKNLNIGKYYVFVTPGLMLLSTLILVIRVLSGAAGASAYTYVLASVGFTFWGVLLILVVLAAVAASVLSFLRHEGIIKF